MEISRKKSRKKKRYILTCIGEFQPGNKTIYVVFDEESEFSGPRTPKLSLDQVFLGKTFFLEKLENIIVFS